MTRVYRMVVMVVDHENIGEADVKACVEEAFDFGMHVRHMEWREIEWTDDHPLNKRATCDDALTKLFGV